MDNLALTITPPDERDLRLQANQWLGRASDVRVTTSDEYSQALTLHEDLRQEWKRLDEMEKSMSKPAWDLHKKIITFFKEPKQFVKDAGAIVKRQLTDWEQAQQRIAREEAAKAQEVARKEREKLEAQAAKAREKGKEERAKALEQRADQVVSTPPPAPVMPKRKGARTTYQATVTDKAALIAAVAAGQVPLEMVEINMKFLNQMARAMKKALDYPGVEVREIRV